LGAADYVVKVVRMAAPDMPALHEAQVSQPITTVRVRITGRVQGVAYRAWTVREASRLSLSGWVRNCRDGSVEALFSGPEAAVRTMIERCHRGPPAARVSSIREQFESPAAESGFHQLPSA
jgi:acylphosphatase